MSTFLRSTRGPLLAAVVPFALLLTLWLCLRYNYSDPAVRSALFVGWLCCVFLLTSLTAITWTAAVTSRIARASAIPDILMGYVFIADLPALLLASISLAGGYLGWLPFLRIYLLLISWLALCVTLGTLCRRLGPGAAVAIPVAVTSLLFGAPVAFVPLARVTQGPAQDYVLQGIGISSPFLAMIDALQSSIRVGWAQLPGMYNLSGLGQDIPMDLPHWYLNTAIYAGSALLLFAVSRLPRRLS